MSLLQQIDEPAMVRPLEGHHKGTVIAVNDASGLGRVKVYINRIFDPVGRPPEFELIEVQNPNGVGVNGRFFAPKKVKNIREELVNALPWAYPGKNILSGVSASAAQYNVPSVGSDVEIWFPFNDVYFPMYVGEWSDNRSLLAQLSSDTIWANQLLEWKKAYSLVMGPWDPFDQFDGRRPPERKYTTGDIEHDLQEAAGSFLFGEDYPFSRGFIDESGTFVKINRAKGTIYLSHFPSNTKIYLDKYGYGEVDIGRLDISPREPRDGDGPLLQQGSNIYNAGSFVSPNLYAQSQPVCLGPGAPPFSPIYDSNSRLLQMNPDSYLWAGLDMEPMIDIVGYNQYFVLEPGQIVYLEMEHDGTAEGNVIKATLKIGDRWEKWPAVVERGPFFADCPTYCPMDGAYSAKKSWKLLAFGEEPSLRSIKPGFNIPKKVRVVFCCRSHLLLEHIYHHGTAFKYPKMHDRPLR